jgi:HSF-type DNA-binding
MDRASDSRPTTVNSPRCLHPLTVNSCPACGFVMDRSDTQSATRCKPENVPFPGTRSLSNQGIPPIHKALSTFKFDTKVYHDFADSTLAAATEIRIGSGHITRAARTGGPKEKFPTMLHLLLTQAKLKGFSHIVHWYPHGRAFEIFDDAHEFARIVMPLYFHHQKDFSSFLRQIHNYGFRRLASRKNCFYHECFLRGRADLTTLMFPIESTGCNTGVKVRPVAAFDPDSVPKFDWMPPLPSDETPVVPMDISVLQSLMDHKSNALPIASGGSPLPTARRKRAGLKTTGLSEEATTNTQDSVVEDVDDSRVLKKQRREYMLNESFSPRDDASARLHAQMPQSSAGQVAAVLHPYNQIPAPARDLLDAMPLPMVGMDGRAIAPFGIPNPATTSLGAHVLLDQLGLASRPLAPNMDQPWGDILASNVQALPALPLVDQATLANLNDALAPLGYANACLAASHLLPRLDMTSSLLPSNHSLHHDFSIPTAASLQIAELIRLQNGLDEHRNLLQTLNLPTVNGGAALVGMRQSLELRNNAILQSLLPETGPVLPLGLAPHQSQRQQPFGTPRANPTPLVSTASGASATTRAVPLTLWQLTRLRLLSLRSQQTNRASLVTIRHV